MSSALERATILKEMREVVFEASDTHQTEIQRLRVEAEKLQAELAKARTHESVGVDMMADRIEELEAKIEKLELEKEEAKTQRQSMELGQTCYEDCIAIIQAAGGDDPWCNKEDVVRQIKGRGPRIEKQPGQLEKQPCQPPTAEELYKSLSEKFVWIEAAARRRIANHIHTNYTGLVRRRVLTDEEILHKAAILHKRYSSWNQNQLDSTSSVLVASPDCLLCSLARWAIAESCREESEPERKPWPYPPSDENTPIGRIIWVRDYVSRPWLRRHFTGVGKSWVDGGMSSGGLWCSWKMEVLADPNDPYIPPPMDYVPTAAEAAGGK